MQVLLSIKETRKQNHWGSPHRDLQTSSSLCLVDTRASSLLRDLTRPCPRPQCAAEDNLSSTICYSLTVCLPHPHVECCLQVEIEHLGNHEAEGQSLGGKIRAYKRHPESCCPSPRGDTAQRNHRNITPLERRQQLSPDTTAEHYSASDLGLKEIPCLLQHLKWTGTDVSQPPSLTELNS